MSVRSSGPRPRGVGGFPRIADSRSRDEHGQSATKRRMDAKGFPKSISLRASTITVRSRECRDSSSRPNTTRRMISNVIACRCGWIGNDAPTGPCIDRPVGKFPTSSCRTAAWRSPWNGGKSNLRSATMSDAIEQQQRVGGRIYPSKILLAPPARNRSGSPVKICLMAFGSLKKTIGPVP